MPKPRSKKREAVTDHSAAQVAELAMQLSGRHLPDYGATRSRHDFTQRQLIPAWSCAPI